VVFNTQAGHAARGTRGRDDRIDQGTVVGEDAKNETRWIHPLSSIEKDARIEINEGQPSLDDGYGGASRRATELASCEN
jgi:hypothetical protein